MMDCYMKAIIMFCLLSLAAATPPSHQGTLIDLMRQCCTSQTSPSLTGVTRRPALHPRVGKYGPVGRRGPPGIVNYTAIEEKIAAKYLDLENRIDEKIEQSNRVANRKLRRCNVKIEEIRNEAEKGITENRKNLEAKFNESFERLERIVVARLERGDTEIEETRNETAENLKRTEENQKNLKSGIDEKIEQFIRVVNRQLERSNEKIKEIRNEAEKGITENRKRIYLWSSCGVVPRTEHEPWEGKGGIINVLRTGRLYEAYCDMTTDGGGWTVFQRRMDGSVDFYRTWEEYAEGFGNKSGEFWLGLEAVYQLTQDGAYELRVDLTDWDGSTAYAKYGTFSISGRSDNYRLTVGEYSGTAGDSLAYHNNHPFSAKNKDLDDWGTVNCATTIGAAWWFTYCAYSSLNGRYNDTSAGHAGVFWYHRKQRWHYSLKGSEMKFRKK